MNINITPKFNTAFGARGIPSTSAAILTRDGILKQAEKIAKTPNGKKFPIMGGNIKPLQTAMETNIETDKMAREQFEMALRSMSNIAYQA